MTPSKRPNKNDKKLTMCAINLLRSHLGSSNLSKEIEMYELSQDVTNILEMNNAGMNPVATSLFVIIMIETTKLDVMSSFATMIAETQN